MPGGSLPSQRESGVALAVQIVNIGGLTIASPKSISTSGKKSDGLGMAVVQDRAKREAAARGLVFLAAFISFVISVSLWFAGHEHQGIFVGTWVPSILALGAMLVPRRAA